MARERFRGVFCAVTRGAVATVLTLAAFSPVPAQDAPDRGKAKPVSKEAALYWERYERLRAAGTKPAVEDADGFVNRLKRLEQSVQATARDVQTIERTLEKKTALRETTADSVSTLEQRLGARLEPLEQAVSNTTALVVTLTHQLNALRERKAEPPSAEITDAVRSLQNAIRAQELAVAQLRTTEAQRDLDQDTRLQSLVNSVNTIVAARKADRSASAGPGAEVRAALAQLGNRLTALETSTASTTSAVARIQATLGDIRSDVAKNDPGKRLTVLEKSAGATASAVAALRTELATVQSGLKNVATGTNVADLQRSLGTTTADLAALQARQEAFGEAVSALEKKLTTNLATLANSTKAGSETAAQTTRALDAQARQFNDLEAETRNLTKSLSACRAEQARMERALADSERSLSRRIEALEENKPAAEPVVDTKSEPASPKADPPQVADLVIQARLLSARGEDAQAEKLFREALSMRENALGRDDARVGASLTDLGLQLMNTGALDEAELLLVRALELYKRTEGPKHAHVGVALNNLAKLREKQQNLPEAADLYRQSVEVFEDALGSRDPNVATALNNLGMLLKRQKKYEEAEDALKRCLKIRERELGEDHPKVGESLNNLGMLYLAWNRPDRCEPLLTQALELYKKAYGDGHPIVRSVEYNLATFYRATGDDEKAQAYEAMASRSEPKGNR